MSKAKSVSEIVAIVEAAIAEGKKTKSDDTPVNINTGVVHGGQHASNVTIVGRIPASKKRG